MPTRSFNWNDWVWMCRCSIEIKRQQVWKGATEVKLSPAGYLLEQLTSYYINILKWKGFVLPASYIRTNWNPPTIKQLGYWGSWVCGVEQWERLQFTPTIGLTMPKAGTLRHHLSSGQLLVRWLILGLGIVLCYLGRLEKLNDSLTPITGSLMTQRCGKISNSFAFWLRLNVFIAILLLLFQVTAGVLTVPDFLNFNSIFGYDHHWYSPDNHYAQLARSAFNSLDINLLDWRFLFYCSMLGLKKSQPINAL